MGSPLRSLLLITLVLATVMAAGCGGRAEQLNNAGNKAFAAGDYAGAQSAYEDALALRGDFAEAQYNLGNTLFRQEPGGDAAQVLQAAALNAAAASPAIAALPNADATPVLAARAWFNLGNVHFGAEEWSAAAEAYRQALRLAPADADAKVNLELALRRMQQNEEPEATPSPTPTPEAGEGTPTATPTPSPTPTPEPSDGEGTPTPEEPTEEPPTVTATPSPTPSLAPSPTPSPTVAPAASGPGTPQAATPTLAPPALLGSEPMTPEQALRLLEAAVAAATSLQERLQVPQRPTLVEKDW